MSTNVKKTHYLKDSIMQSMIKEFNSKNQLKNNTN